MLCLLLMLRLFVTGVEKKVKVTKDRQKTDLFTMIDISVIAVGGVAVVKQN